MANLDGIRKALMYEPRGHSAMSGAILQPPSRPDADWGVVFIEVSGCLPMCGHGTIGVATVLVETGMVEVTEPVTRVRLDTPAGLVVAEVKRQGRRRGERQPRQRARLHPRPGPDRDRPRYGQVTYDMAYGGNFYAILGLDQVGIPFDRANKDGILSRGPGRDGRDQRRQRARAPGEPGDPRLPSRAVPRSGRQRQALPARDGHLPGVVRPLAVRHRHLGPPGAAAHPR